MPDIKGLKDFKGEVYHTGHWPHHPVDFTGKRVAVIGTGSSAIQSVPVIAEQARHLTVFQRTANFSIPARNASLTTEEREAFRRDYPEIRRFAREEARNGIYQELPDRGALDDGDNERRAKYEARWAKGGLTFMGVYNNLALDQAANDTAAGFVREKIAEIVRDPDTAKLLQPNNHPIGSKRICVDTDYYATFNRPNVTLVDIKIVGIDEILPNAVRAAAKDYEVDALVLATGFDAMTGSVAKIDIVGRDGKTLNQKWAEGPRTYLGLMSAGFPNLFVITGPGSPSVLSNMIVSIEQHVDWITDCVGYMRERGLATMEAEREAEDKWVAHVNEVAHGTLYPQANSWYMGANIPGKPRIFMPYIGGVGVYRQICNDVAAKGYEGFAMTAAGESGSWRRHHNLQRTRIEVRHVRACPGHPRQLNCLGCKKNVGGRDKPGHDGEARAPIDSQQPAIRTVPNSGLIAPSARHVCRRLRLFRRRVRECDRPYERLKSDVRSGRRFCRH